MAMTDEELDSHITRYFGSALTAFWNGRMRTALREILIVAREGGGSGGGTTTDASDLIEGILSNDRLQNIPQAKVENLTTDLSGKSPSSHTHATSQITGLDLALTGKASSVHTHIISDVTGLQTSLNIKADLVDGKVPASQLPVYVDDIIEYANFAAFPGTGVSGILYVALDTDIVYRWSGSTYIDIGAVDLVLGETSVTAYRGDRGKIAYDHSQSTGNVHGLTLDTITDGTTNRLFTATEKTKLGGVSSGATANSSDAALRDRSTHTGQQSPSTISGLATVATSGSWNDITSRPTIPVASDTAYDATTWNGNTDVPTKNAVRDKFESLGTSSTIEMAATKSAVSASTTVRFVYVTADETNNGDKTLYIHNGTTLILVQTLA